MSSIYTTDFHQQQPSLVAQFTFRHILENTDHYLIEVRNNLEFDGIVDAPFRWLKIGKDFIEVAPMHLRSQDSSWDIEERFFEEGYLKFSNSSGIFIEKFNSGQHQYQYLGREMEQYFGSALNSYFDKPAVLVN